MTRANPRTSHIYAGIAAREGIKAKAEIHSYQDCRAFLSAEGERNLASNVKVRHWSGVNGEDRCEVVLYTTVILIYYKDGTFSADNGGHNTPTTSARCNQFGPRRYLFSHKKKKLVAYDTRGGHKHPTGHDRRYPVEGGIPQ